MIFLLYSETNECLRNPCGKGNCTDLIGKYKCECPEYYKGDQCEISEKYSNIH